ncbi:MAG: NAD(P)H-dependent oxidoreductase [Chitinophagaceae bacterium]|nr:NAD(P)H-dependent oxidoreductase [Chitinophagaceae bacterium]
MATKSTASCYTTTMDDHYLIISGTNRRQSNTSKVARLYEQLLDKKSVSHSYLSLEGWNWLERSPGFEKMERELLIPANRYIFVVPEYNGSIPGVLKLMIDITDHRTVWQGKKALLTGVSTGRAGNLRGMEHMTGILHYLKVHVHPNKLPISAVDKLLDASGTITEQSTLHAINTQIDEFINFN